jgi:large subunit ribosomal protein L2
MGKRILVQRKGRGGLNFRSPSHKHIGAVHYRNIIDRNDVKKFKIIELLHSPGRGAPVAKVRYNDGEVHLYLPPEGVYVGDELTHGTGGLIEIGNISPIGDIPLGTYVFNLESTPFDGGKFVRSSGATGLVVSHSQNSTEVQFPSKKTRSFNNNCLSTIGVVAGGGRTEKPFVKAGNRYHYVKPKAKKYPVVRGVAMVAASHPHGGGSKQGAGKPTTVSRNAPPGRKVGLIAARRSGRKK